MEIELDENKFKSILMGHLLPQDGLKDIPKCAKEPFETMGNEQNQVRRGVYKKVFDAIREMKKKC